MHYNAEGVPLDYPAAAVWYKKAAEGGNIFAQNNLATMYVAGQGLEKDYGKAAKWFMEAAEKSDQFAIFNFASLYDKGDGVEKDSAKAADYYRSAAEIGHVPSQSRLGYMYANGIGVARNRIEAFMWLSLAAQHGIGSALVALETVVEAMSAEEKLEGQRLLDARRRPSRVLLGALKVESVEVTGRMLPQDLKKQLEQRDERILALELLLVDQASRLLAVEAILANMAEVADLPAAAIDERIGSEGQRFLTHFESVTGFVQRARALAARLLRAAVEAGGKTEVAQPPP